MFLEVYGGKKSILFFSQGSRCLIRVVVFILFIACSTLYGQQTGISQFYSQTGSGYTRTSSVFHQEIARMEISVTRPGKEPLSLTQVPRVQKDDVLKLRLLDEPVNGIKIDQSQWDWTLLVAFVNPSHRMIEARNGKAIRNETESGTVSEEIQFRKSGWYKEYSFKVPYDSQPVFFLYPRPKYRKQLLKVVGSKYEEIRKLGEKTIEIAGAYAQISSFLNEMQMVLNRNTQIYGYSNNTSNTNVTNPYGTYNPYGLSNPYGTTTQASQTAANVPLFGLQGIPMMNQIVEGLARSFNINLPACWANNSSYGGTSSANTNPYGNYTSAQSTGFSNYQNYGGYSLSGVNTTTDFINRAQCVAKNVNLEDFDISIMKMWQQGGVFLAAELQQKYPQLAYWINIAAVAIDFIVKVFQKSPLRIVPTIIQSNDPQGGYGSNSSSAFNGNQYSSNYSSTSAPTQNQGQSSVKISLFADSQPSEGQFVTAYPIVVHKWQANPDPDVISLYPPVLAEPCLHAGVNILKSTDLRNQWSDDIYSRDFRVVISSENGFRKEFPLRKNMGLGAWELNITSEDMNQIPKVNMALEAELVGTRGFNEIKSPKFILPLSLGGSYEVTPESQKLFSVGGKRIVSLRNTLGSCRCLQRVVYKPSFGGQFVYEVNQANQDSPNSLSYSSDGREVSFEIDTTNFQPGDGTLEIKTYGLDNPQTQLGQTPQTTLNNNLQLKLYAAPPVISAINARRGDHEILLIGEKLDQIQSIMINGKQAIFKDNPSSAGLNAANNPETSVSNSQTALPSQWNSAAKESTASVLPTVKSPIVLPQISPSQSKNISSGQRTAVFLDSALKINSETVSLELNLENNRTFIYPNKFSVGIARPTIRMTGLNEIEGTFLNQSIVNIQNNQVIVTPQSSKPKAQSEQIDIGNYPVVSVEKLAITVAVQNILTDYSFKNENITIETRIENAGTNPTELPRVNFDVLDSNNLRLNFDLNPVINKNLSGRRLQFRIVDRERGESDWYSIKQTFVRIPQIDSVICTNAVTNPCELKGEGLDYIAQVSTDGGKSWFPQMSSSPMQVELSEDGKTKMKIPMLINQNFLQIKLRDYPNTEGLPVVKFTFLNKIKKNETKPTTNNKISPTKSGQSFIQNNYRKLSLLVNNGLSGQQIDRQLKPLFGLRDN